jgi:hypothetical protein
MKIGGQGRNIRDSLLQAVPADTSMFGIAPYFLRWRNDFDDVPCAGRYPPAVGNLLATNVNRWLMPFKGKAPNINGH